MDLVDDLTNLFQFCEGKAFRTRARISRWPSTSPIFSTVSPNFPHSIPNFPTSRLVPPFSSTLPSPPLQIGLLSLQMIDYELQRWELWREQIREMDEQGKSKWLYAMRKQDQLVACAIF